MSEEFAYSPENSEQQLTPETSLDEMRDIRQKMEAALLKAGLVRKVYIQQAIPGGKQIRREQYQVPQVIVDALKNNPTYREIYGIESIQVFQPTNFGSEVEVRIAERDRSSAIRFSIGEEGHGKHHLAFFPSSRSEPEFNYSYDEKKLAQPSENPNTVAQWPKVDKDVKAALNRLQRFPGDFRPGLKDRMVGIANRVGVLRK